VADFFVSIHKNALTDPLAKNHKASLEMYSVI